MFNRFLQVFINECKEYKIQRLVKIKCINPTKYLCILVPATFWHFICINWHFCQLGKICIGVNAYLLSKLRKLMQKQHLLIVLQFGTNIVSIKNALYLLHDQPFFQQIKCRFSWENMQDYFYSDLVWHRTVGEIKKTFVDYIFNLQLLLKNLKHHHLILGFRLKDNHF